MQPTMATEKTLKGALRQPASRLLRARRAPPVLASAHTINFVTTSLNMGAATKFHIAPGQPLPSTWTQAVAPCSVGPTIRTPAPGTIQFYTNHQTGHDQWARVCNSATAATGGCPGIRFNMRIVTLTGSEARLELPGGVCLRLTDNGTKADWAYHDGSSGSRLAALAPSSIRPDCCSHDVIVAYSPNMVTVVEDGNLMFTHATSKLGDAIAPSFDVQVLDTGASLDLQVDSIFLIPGSG